MTGGGAQELAQFFVDERCAFGLLEVSLLGCTGQLGTSPSPADRPLPALGCKSAISQIESGAIGLSLDMLRQIVAQLGGEVEVTAVFKDRRVALDA